MTQKGTTREEIPEHFLKGKQTAAAQFLAVVKPVTFAAFAASTRPEQNVVGVGIGYKITKGKVTSGRCVRLYVERKLAKGAISSQFLLPETIAGVPTDVIETGRFRALRVAVPITQRRLRPAKPGCSVGFQFTSAKANFVMAGTLGAIVEANGVLFILSNNHVLADENSLPAGSPIFQPGLLDQGDPAHDQIARLTRFIALQAGPQNKVDCAIAEVLDRETVRATFLARVGRLRSKLSISAVEGMRVHKVGRTTGYTTGTVFDVSADVTVTYEMGQVVFQDQVLIQGTAGMFSDAGDSGSLIVDRATQRVTALLFAGSPSHTIANHISDVLAQLSVSMVI